MDKKKRKKKIESLKKQRNRHLEKIRKYRGRNYALIDYWEKEVENFEEEIAKEERKLKGKDQ